MNETGARLLINIVQCSHRGCSITQGSWKENVLTDVCAHVEFDVKAVNDVSRQAIDFIIGLYICFIIFFIEFELFTSNDYIMIYIPLQSLETDF